MSSQLIASFSFILSLALFVLPSPALSQVLYGSLTGILTDGSGAAVANANVVATNTSTGVSKQAKTDERGGYLIQDIQAGTYNVAFVAPAFATTVQSGVQIVENAVRRIDVQLQLATIGQTVTVAADAAVLETDRADVNSQISTRELADLPLTGTNGSRNFESVLKVVPGFTPPAASHSISSNPTTSQQFNVNGSTFTGNSVRLDGANDVFTWLPEAASYIPPAEAIETVNVVTNSFDAQQGSAVGSAVNAIIKSGTNQFHGAAWEFNTNSDLKARNFFYYGSNNPKNILNQFGLDLGGPIKKNKLFFFVDWERTLQRQLYSTYQSVPTAGLRQGLFAGTGVTVYNPATGTANGAGRTQFLNNAIPTSSISPAAAKMIALIPMPNVAGAGVSNNYFATGDWAFTRDNVDIKVNYNPTAKSSAFARYSIQPSHLFDPQALGPAGGQAIDGGQPGNGPGRIQSASIGGTYTITPALLLDANIGFTRLHLSAKNTDINQNYGLNVLGIPGTNGPSPLDGGYPNFAITGFSSLGNSNASSPFEFRDNQFVESINLGWVKGSHNLRFGGEFLHFSMAHFGANSTVGVRGGFTFTGGLTSLNGGASSNLYNAFADFLLGLPTSTAQDHQYIDPATLYENTFAFYARDQWQISRKLTINYGLRYEIYPYSQGGNGIGGIHYNVATNIVQLTGKNVDTGKGYVTPRLGIAYRLDDKTVLRVGYGINTNSETFRNNIQTYPGVISAQYSGADSYSAAGSLATGIPPFVGPNLSAGQLPLPSNVGSWIYPTPYRRGYAQSYNVTIQRQIGKSNSVQVAYVGTRDIRPSGGININAAGPGTAKAGLPLYQLYGNASVISELAPVDASKYNSLQARASHRSGDLTFGAAYTFSKAMDAVDSEEGSALTWNWAPIQYRNYALGGFDRTHNFQLYGTYPLSFGKSKAMLSHGVGSAIAGGWQLNAILSRTSGTPFTVGASATSLNSPGNSQTANQVMPTVQILGGHGPGSPYFNPNAFAAVTTATFGNSGRDILRGPGFFNLDASLFRNFALREFLTLQFRAEALGLTNTPQFANPGSTFGTSTYDVISSSTGERQFRFALKLSF